MAAIKKRGFKAYISFVKKHMFPRRLPMFRSRSRRYKIKRFISRHPIITIALALWVGVEYKRNPTGTVSGDIDAIRNGLMSIWLDVADGLWWIFTTMIGGVVFFLIIALLSKLGVFRLIKKSILNSRLTKRGRGDRILKSLKKDIEEERILDDLYESS